MLHRAAHAAVALVVAVVLVAFASQIGGFGASSVEAQAPPNLKLGLKYTGVASCGASNCHGATKPKPEYPKLNENIVWTQKDRHGKAFTTLTNEKLKSGVSPKKIAENLKIAKAETSDRCLKCHATPVPPNLRGPKFDISDGVGCDSCHGPAEKWLEQHAEKGWTHEKSVAAGMYDTKNLLLRADQCASCHLQIEPDMVVAGHPDLLAFELATFISNMPPHWGDKGAFATTKLWALGQVIALREAAANLSNRAKAGANEKLLKEALTKVQGHGAVVKHVVADAKSIDQQVTSLADLVGKGDKAGIQAGATKLASSMNAEAPKINTANYDQAATQKFIKGITDDAEVIGGAGVRAAEQAAMALDRLYDGYSKAPGSKPDKAAGAALDKVFGTIEDPAKFDAKKFATEVKGFASAFK